ncbi:MAG: CpsB/CapC family capsule biosynthesis tyrosine phosphatase, partial [Hominimerdicola sp.]
MENIIDLQIIDNGMVDLHCHVLPGVDDGSDCLDTSLEMLELSAESGVTDVVCTPHCIPGYFENYKGEALYAKFEEF